MARFHINPVTGQAGTCKAQAGGCPFGGADEHFDSREEAMANYETVMAGMTIPQPTAKDELRERLISEAEKQTLREQARAKVDDDADTMIAEVHRIGDEIFGDERANNPRDPRFPEIGHLLRAGLVDTLEGRTGPRLDENAFISVPDPDDPMGMPIAEGTRKELEGKLIAGSYEGTYVDEATGETEQAFIGVHKDGTVTAHGRDLRDDLGYRKELALKKRDELARTAEMWTSLSHDVAETREQVEDYSNLVSTTERLVAETDWNSPEAAAGALDVLYEMGEDFETKGERADMEGDFDNANHYHTIAGTIEQLQEGAYELAGHQKLPPMKK